MEELVGELVIVNPQLPFDPANQQGMIGTIILADLKMDEITVNFGNNHTGVYAADALLTLQSKHEVYQQVLLGTQTLDQEDYKTMHRVNMFQDINTRESIAKAYDLLAENHAVLKLATISLLERIDLSRGTDQGLDRGSSRRR
ncbi:hypothetical protein [Pedobacter sp. MC2016-24]|uniref:hypothetical protein n=1 Tax=Pedobacter sp. MC2016-24 TaxID=2780090 RepID=UPI001880AD40|nr:hypothetical protein [Pedobacter sp. MC2016-24]MBE9599908.1 hypothetical protein [Pedobacter sp. MC2016-24]